MLLARTPCDVASFIAPSPNVELRAENRRRISPLVRTLGTGLTSRGQRELGSSRLVLWAAWKRLSSKDLGPYPGNGADHLTWPTTGNPTKCGVCDG